MQKLAMCTLLLAGFACGTKNTDEPGPAGGTVVGPAGGTVTGPSGAQVVIPPGALATDTTIKIEQTSAGAPALPTGFSSFGPMFAFTPHGTVFAVPVTMTVPFDPASVPAGTTPALYKTDTQNHWARVANVTIDAGTVSGQVTGFSNGTAGVERLAAQRQWEFDIDKTGEIILGDDFQTSGRDEVHPIEKFPANPIALDGDRTTTLETFSSADGVTFWAKAEDVGGAQLIQTQGFIKRADNATLQFVITAAVLEAVDENLPPTDSECPRGKDDLKTCAPIHAGIEFAAVAVDANWEEILGADGRPILDAFGEAFLDGRNGLWSFQAPMPAFDVQPPLTLDDITQVWTVGDFDYTNDGIHPRALLNHQIVIDVDLSTLPARPSDSPAKEPTFYVSSLVSATAVNGRARESAVRALVRDPAEIGGTVMNIAGLELTDDRLPPRPPVGVTPPTPCATGPDPAAGQLQFSAATYSLLELHHDGPNDIVVTRTQGSKGAVSATFTTGGGTAVPGVDYTPVGATVHFADGDTRPRTIPLTTLRNDEVAADKTVNLTLSQPGGCATLGAQSSAVLTILDDDGPPPTPFSGLDTSFGDGGKVVTKDFGGDQTAMALQPDGKIVMVGGSIGDFVLARYDADGSLDASFGDGGKVTTNIVVERFSEEAARGVAIQPDGKIVVVGYGTIAGRPVGSRFGFVLARYNGDGSLDTAFGSGGTVANVVIGQAFAVAIQPDRKIVVAGSVPVGPSNLENDFVVARYLEDGRLDPSFQGGMITTDFALGIDIARNVVLQPDGAIVVSGEVQTVDQTAVARYLPDGTLDPSFGDGGKVLLDGARVGEGLALQGDGKMVLVGSVDAGVFPMASTQFALMRLGSDGAPDTGFGGLGTVSTAFTELDDAARAVTLQGDGRIVVAGLSSSRTNPNFAVARYHPDGTLDATFGEGGKQTVDLFGFADVAENVAVQPDGKVVLGGFSRTNLRDEYALARLVP